METRYAIQWKPKGDEDTPLNWLYFVAYADYASAVERYHRLVKVNGRHFDYQVILTPGGEKVFV